MGAMFAMMRMSVPRCLGCRYGVEVELTQRVVMVNNEVVVRARKHEVGDVTCETDAPKTQASAKTPPVGSWHQSDTVRRVSYRKTTKTRGTRYHSLE